MHAFSIYDSVRTAPTYELRKRVAFAATLCLALHEQMLFQSSECYGDPLVKRVTARLTPTLTISDPIDVMALLPGGGNWANFADRIGLVETSACPGSPSVTIVDPDGVQRTYRLAEEQHVVAGSIADYLHRRLMSDQGERLIAHPALPLPLYDDGEGTALARLRQSYLRMRGRYDVRSGD